MSRYLNLFSVFLAYIIVEGYIKFERKSIYIINVCKKEGYFIIPILSFTRKKALALARAY